MSERRLYGRDALFTLPLIDAGAQSFESTPVTIAAGDMKVWTDRAIAANPSAKTIAFTSGGTEEPQPGDTLTGATSSATCVLMFAVVTSGTWAGGDAAGFLFVKSDSGTFQSENINNTSSGTTNVLTIGAALDAAGLFKHLGGGMYVCALTASEMACSRGFVKLQDQTATEEWEDTAINFETYGPELGIATSGRTRTFGAASITLAAGHGLTDDHIGSTVYIASSTGNGAKQVRIITDLATNVATVDQAWDTLPTGSVEYFVYAGEDLSTSTGAGVNVASIYGSVYAARALSKIR